MKTNWQIKKLGDVVNFERGLTYTKTDEVNFSGSAVLRANNINLGTASLDFSEIKYINDIVKIPESKKVVKGSIIVCTASGSKSHLGKIALIDKDYDYAFGGFMGQITPKKEIISKFLFYILTSNEYKKFISKLSNGMNINNLKFDDLKKFNLPIPSIFEQHRIVKILDKVFGELAKAKENTEKNLQNAKDLFESYSQSVYTNIDEAWEKKKLIDIFQIKPQKKEAREKLKDNDLVSFVPMEDLGIKSKEFNCIKERKLKDVSGSYTYFANEDVLLAKITPCFENGKLGIAHNLKNGIGFGSSEYIVFRSKGEVISDYLYYFLAREQYRKEGTKRMSGAVGHKRVSKEYIEETILPFPKSLSEQKSIVKKLDELSEKTKRLEEIYKQKLADLKELKKSILAKAFRGEL